MSNVRILSEIEQVTLAYPDQEVKEIILTYQVEGMAPRTVWIRKDLLPDYVYLEQNPGAKEVPAEIKKRGEWRRFQAIWEDLGKIKVAKPRPLEL